MARAARTPEPHSFFETLEPRRLLSGGADDLTHTLYYPEGFAHEGISEFVPMTNPNAFDVRYELHARYETGERDQLVASGVIPAGSRAGVTLSTAGDPASMLVRPDAPYALIVRSSAPISATISHYDFGTAIGESFTDRASTVWTFGEGYKDTDWTRDFIIFYNTSDDDAVVTLTAYTGDGATIAMTTTVGAQRRGGWSLDDDDRLPRGVFGVKLEANRPVVAALSHYEIVTERGYGALGAADGGATAGVIPALEFEDRGRGRGSDDGPGDDNGGDRPRDDRDDDDDDDGRRGRGRGGDDDREDDNGGRTRERGYDDSPHPNNAYLTVLNTADTPATVTFTFFLRDDDGPPLNEPVRTIVVPPRSRGGLTVRELGFPFDDELAAVYRSDIPVTVTTAVYFGRDAVGMEAISTAATTWDFAEGYMDRVRAGRAVTEDIYVFNPTSSSTTVTIDFFFTNGQSVRITKDLAPLEIEDIKVDLRDEIIRAGDVLFYGVRVAAPVPVVATLEHWDRDLGGGFATPGLPGGTILPLADVLVL